MKLGNSENEILNVLHV